MENNDIIVGLDIGTTKICTIVGRKNEFGKIEILGLGKSDSIGVSRGVVLNIEQTVQSIRTAVAEAENKSEVDIKVVNVGIAGLNEEPRDLVVLPRLLSIGYDASATSFGVHL